MTYSPNTLSKDITPSTPSTPSSFVFTHSYPSHVCTCNANNEHDDIRPYCGNCNSTSLMTFARRSRRTQQRTPPPSPLDLPEVLELVLSHLSQYSLNHRARLVSKFWNSTSLRLIHRTLTWSDQINIPEQQRILDQVGYTSILRITTRVPHLPRSLHFEDVAWGNLYGAYKPRLRQLPTPPRLGSTRIPMVLEQLVIEGILNMNRRLQPLWPLIPSVRTIRIKTVHKNDYHIEIILRSCSNLTELFLEPVGVFAFPIHNAIGLAGAGPTTTSEYHSNLASWTRARLQHSTALAGSGTSSPHPTVLNPKLIWACRNLQTLHLSFQARMGDSDNAEQNRIIFGYIGRVCPRLRELVLFRSLMRLSLDGGLCLLTRLVDLERLTVGARVPCKMSDKDFSWLARPVKDASLKTAGQGLRQEAAASGSTTPWTKALHSLLFGDRHQAKARQGVGHGPSPLSSEPSSPLPPDSRPATPAPFISGLRKTKKPESAADQEMALRKLLKHLGTSRDVREVLEEKDQDPGGCWPRLEELTIHFSEPLQSDPVDLQKIVAKYRPEIQFSGARRK
ncbi:hypothetical protein BGZ52_003785 [Haplosporangium bisporale]|nr:hypothetical protein BGZ52_003785 [Haplosporangium bisporale]